MEEITIKQGKHIKRFDFWNPATWEIPKLYWDAYSQEQRIHAICRQLGKVIAYADYVGVNVDDIAQRLQDIEDGKLDDFIVAAIEKWFNENQTAIMEALNNLQEALPIADYSADHTVTDEFDGVKDRITVNENSIATINGTIGTGLFSPENTITDVFNDFKDDTEEADETLSKRIADLELDVKSSPNFRCVDRFIFGEWGVNGITAAQAGCVFTQNGKRYWAQTMNSDTANNDHFIIRDIDTNTTVADITGQFGHGYSLSYNASTKQIMTCDTESSPFRILLINVENVSAPHIDRIIIQSGSEVTIPTWFDDTHYIELFEDNTMRVRDIDTNAITENWILDLHGYSYGHGFITQNIDIDRNTGEAYIGATSPDSIIVCDIDYDNKKIVMKDCIAMKQYYGCLYMREMEFAYRNGDTMYINQFDEIDGLMVVALLEWNIIDGTIPEENSRYIQPTGNVGNWVNWDTGLLIQNDSGSNRWKLAGDAINNYMSIGAPGRCFLLLETDYPNVISVKGAKIAIQTSTTASFLTIGGINAQSADVIIANSVPLHVQPKQTVTATGATHYVGIRAIYSFVRCAYTQQNKPELAYSMTNNHLFYCENTQITCLMANQGLNDSTNWFRWCNMFVSARTSLSDATLNYTPVVYYQE